LAWTEWRGALLLKEKAKASTKIVSLYYIILYYIKIMALKYDLNLTDKSLKMI